MKYLYYDNVVADPDMLDFIVKARGADRVLFGTAEFEWRFSRRYDLAAMTPRLAWAATRMPPMPHRLIEAAEKWRVSR